MGAQPSLSERVSLFKDRRPRMAHAEDLNRPGWALCGFKLDTKRPMSATESCVVCMSMVQGHRGFTDR